MSLDDLAIRHALKPVEAELDRQKEKCAAMKAANAQLLKDNSTLQAEREQLNDATAAALDAFADATRELNSRLAETAAERDALATALQKVSDIRDSIIGAQSFNWSEHAYPLVAVLGAAGFEGKGYEIASANLGTLIEQTKAAETERDALAKRVEKLRCVVETAHASQRANLEMITRLRAEAATAAERQRVLTDALERLVRLSATPGGRKQGVALGWIREVAPEALALVTAPAKGEEAKRKPVQCECGCGPMFGEAPAEPTPPSISVEQCPKVSAAWGCRCEKSAGHEGICISMGDGFWGQTR